MKKIILIFLLAISVLPTFGANWVQWDSKGKKFVDISSLRKENELGRYYVYSVWEKFLNDGSDGYINIEKIYNKKAWYNLTKVSFDCTNKELRVDASTYYDLNGSVINIYDNTYYSHWIAITPDSFGESVYKEVCKGF